MSEGSVRFAGSVDACMSARGGEAITGSAQTPAKQGAAIQVTGTSGNITFITLDGSTIALTGVPAWTQLNWTVKSITSATLSGFVMF